MSQYEVGERGAVGGKWRRGEGVVLHLFICPIIERIPPASF